MAVPLEDICWQRFINGEKDAFRELYDQYVDRLFSFGCRYCRDEEVVKDCIHDLFIDLHHYRTRLSTDVNVGAYLYRSLQRKIAAYAAKRQTQLKAGYHSTDDAFVMEWDVERILVRHEEDAELFIRLAHELNSLTQRQQEALYLRFASEMSYEEVADIMGISVASCRTVVYRAIKDLRKKLEGVSVSLLFLLVK